MRSEQKPDLERRAVRAARIRGLAAKGFSTTEIAAEVGETRGLVWVVLRPAAVALGERYSGMVRNQLPWIAFL